MCAEGILTQYRKRVVIEIDSAFYYNSHFFSRTAILGGLPNGCVERSGHDVV